MDENIVNDISKIGKLITKTYNIQEHIGMGQETGLGKTKIYKSDPVKKVTPEKVDLYFTLLKDYEATLSQFQPMYYNTYGSVQTITNPPENKMTLKKGTKGRRIGSDITIGGLSFKCGGTTLSRSNLSNILKPYTYNSPELIKVLNGVCTWTMDSYRELLKKNTTPETETQTQTQTETNPTKSADEIKTEQCSLDCNSRYPYYSVECDGASWSETLNSWIKEKGGGKDKTTYKALRTSWCSGWRPGQTQENLVDFIVPIFSDSSTTTTTTQQINQPTVF
jgi:hypothetical protein